MQAVRVHPAPASSMPYSPSNPAPPSALQLDQHVPIPEPAAPGDLLVRVTATTVIRDSLTWPETYHAEYAILGNDVAGVVESVGPGSVGRFKAGDEVFGMAHPTRVSTWAAYTIMKEDEVTPKPSNLSWEQAASMPLSALTAYEALFVHAGLPAPAFLDSSKDEPQRQSTTTASQKPRRVLITGAAGGVGVYLVQLARIAGLEVVAASGSNLRNRAFLERLGADQTVEYGQLKVVSGKYDLIIDTVGGDVLAGCWSLVADSGTLLTVDSLSAGFVEEHGRRGLSEGKESVKAFFFIVSGGRSALQALAGLAELGLLLPFVAETFPMASARQAYERASVPSDSHGKVVLTV
ncbi:alcohol dehydrogenase [Aspergillus sp. HF37]|nr:alcohol dehydrogenase [Aspergillus sp. HF37]